VGNRGGGEEGSRQQSLIPSKPFSLWWWRELSLRRNRTPHRGKSSRTTAESRAAGHIKCNPKQGLSSRSYRGSHIVQSEAAVTTGPQEGVRGRALLKPPLVGVVMILPQVHLRKPCYDFTFL
jgi:hypothetical protein